MSISIHFCIMLILLTIGHSFGMFSQIDRARYNGSVCTYTSLRVYVCVLFVSLALECVSEDVFKNPRNSSLTIAT